MNATETPQAPSASGTPLLRVRGAVKSFGPVRALDGVDLDVHAGEVVALVGDNGAGKSTLVKAIAGVSPADSGVIEWEGSPVHITSPTDAQKVGIATVFQDLALCDNLDLVANLFLGREAKNGRSITLPERRIPLPRGRAINFARKTLRFGPLDEITMEKRSKELLEELSVTTIQDVRSPVGLLSGGQRQSVAIARSLLGEPRVVILDEPTAALGVAQTAEVLSLVERLRDRNFGVILISHNLPDIFAVTDRIAVLRLGKNAGEYVTAETDQQEIVSAITGADVNAVTKRLQERAKRAEEGGES